MRRRRLVAAALIAAAAAGAAALALVLRGGPEVVTHGPRDRPWIALTFDADMDPSMLARLRSGQVRSWYDPAIVRELRAARIPATIFLTGLWAQTYPDVVRSLARDPLFELESHSMDHAAFERPCFGLAGVESEEEKRREVSEAAAVITSVAGVAPRYFRFPGGCYDEADLGLVVSLGQRPVQWDVLSGDSFERDPAAVARSVAEQARPGSIVVMHLNGAPNAPATARALRILIPELRNRGFRFVTLRQLLA